MSPNQIATQSVIDIHQRIAKVFTTHNSTDLRQLLDAFHPDFQMITMSGQLVTLANIKNLFTSKQGTRPTLEIMIEGITIITHTPENVWLQYAEIHHEHGQAHQRLSTACVVIQGNHWQWLYLHETPISLSI